MAALPDLSIEVSPATAAGGDDLYMLQERLKVLLWLGVTTLTLAFAWKLAEFMPPEIDLAYWTAAEFVALFGFHRLFIQGLPNTNGAGDKMTDVLWAVLWALALALNIITMWRTVKRLPTTLAVFVCTKTAFLAIWGFYAVFLSRVVRSAPILPLLKTHGSNY